MDENDRGRFMALMVDMGSALSGKEMSPGRIKLTWEVLRDECTFDELRAAALQHMATEEWQPTAKTLLSLIRSRRPVETIKPEKREPMKIPPRAAAMIANILSRGNVEVIR